MFQKDVADQGKKGDSGTLTINLTLPFFLFSRTKQKKKKHSLPLSSPMTQLDDQLAAVLAKREQIAKLRRLVVNPNNAIDFSSNDFLGLAKSPVLRERLLQELATMPNMLGSGGSRLLDGNSQYALDLENRIARFHGAESALLFNSGFDANSGLFGSLPQKGDIVVYDELVHASVHEGMRVSRAGRLIPFKHSDVADLERILADLVPTRVNVFVAVETVYSMDGDVAPLQEIIQVLKKFWPQRENGYLVVDEVMKKSRNVYVYRYVYVCIVSTHIHLFAGSLCRHMLRAFTENEAVELFHSLALRKKSLHACTPLARPWQATVVSLILD